MKAEYVFWFTVLSLVFAVGMLGFRANKRRGNGPLVIGFMAGILIIISKSYLRVDYLSSTGIFLLVAASVWNVWPRKGATGVTGIQLEPHNENRHR